MCFAAETSLRLQGKLQNFRVFSIGDVTVSIGEAATPWCVCCGNVAVSIGEAATLSCVLLRTRCRVYRGSCNTLRVLHWRRRCVYRGSCNTLVFCCRDVAVSLGAKLCKTTVLECVAASSVVYGSTASLVVYGSTGTCFCKFCSIL